MSSDITIIYKFKIMEQKDFFEYVEERKNHLHNRFTRQINNGSDPYFLIGELFAKLGINGWNSDRFCNKFLTL